MSSYLPIAAGVLLPQAGNFVTSLLFPNMNDQIYSKQGRKAWYDTLKLPPWTPPKWVFPPVWLGLYSSIGYASYLVWKDGGGFQGDNILPLAVYGANLLSNWIWSPLFFNKHLLKPSMVVITFMWGSAIVCGKLFYDVNPTAGYLYAPYVGWLTLASTVMYRIWRDNPDKSE